VSAEELKRIRRHIDELELARRSINNTIARLKNREYALQNGAKPAYHPRTPNEVVPRLQVKEKVEIWLDLFQRQHFKDGKTILAENSGVSVQTIKNILGLSEQGKNQKMVELGTADKLFHAMNMEHALHELDVFTYTENGFKLEIPEPPFTHFEED